MVTNHTIMLPALGAFLLLNAVEQPGWANSARDLNDAFSLMSVLDNIPEIKNPLPEVKKAANQRIAYKLDKHWCSAIVKITLSDRQRDAARKCLTTLRDQGKIPPGIATAAIMTAFSLDAD